MLRQKDLIDSDNWRVLVILDACRYDYFEELYKDYFEGILYKCYSSGSCTNEWCKNTFTKYYENVIYVSGNPYINSIKSVSGFDAKKHFPDIIDVWRFGWNTKLGTVHPGTLTHISQNLLEKNPEKKFIIHYLQPHSPYLGSLQSPGYPSPNPEKQHMISGLYDGKNLRYNTNENLTKVLEWFFKGLGVGNIHINKISRLLGLPPRDPMDYIYREYGISKLKEAYKKNLMIVLENLLKLTSKISGKIVISTDHGELLGEDNMIGHPGGCNHPLLSTIPWFEID